MNWPTFKRRFTIIIQVFLCQKALMRIRPGQKAQDPAGSGSTKQTVRNVSQPFPYNEIGLNEFIDIESPKSHHCSILVKSTEKLNRNDNL
jgi:hypothetical protein